MTSTKREMIWAGRPRSSARVPAQTRPCSFCPGGAGTSAMGSSIDCCDTTILPLRKDATRPGSRQEPSGPAYCWDDCRDRCWPYRSARNIVVVPLLRGRRTASVAA